MNGARYPPRTLNLLLRMRNMRRCLYIEKVFQAVGKSEIHVSRTVIVSHLLIWLFMLFCGVSAVFKDPPPMVLPSNNPDPVHQHPGNAQQQDKTSSITTHPGNRLAIFDLPTSYVCNLPESSKAETGASWSCILKGMGRARCWCQLLGPQM